MKNSLDMFTLSPAQDKLKLHARPVRRNSYSKKRKQGLRKKTGVEKKSIDYEAINVITKQ